MERAMSEMTERLTSAHGALTDLRPAVGAGEPWPLSSHLDPGPESSWGPAEVLAHLAEMLPYWREQAELVMEGRPGPTPFGRAQTDESRIRRIDGHRLLPVGELYDRIEAAVIGYAEWFPVLDSEALRARGLHRTLGEMPVAEILERFVIAHFDEHVAQLAVALGNRPARRVD